MNKTIKVKTGIICPVCNKGYLDKINGRHGLFYGCDRFPECEHTEDYKE